MSKIICEVCGTSYSETAAQCPICGCVRPADADAVNETAEKSYTYVKGGRFSKSNVRKRNNGAHVAPVKEVKRTAPAKKEIRTEEEDTEKSSGSKGLVITAIVLMVAIIAVVAYIVLHFFYPLDFITDKPGTSAQVIACTDIKLDVNTVTFNNAGDAKMIYATVLPEDTTDTVTFTSEDTSVAKVNQQGKIVAVGNGMTTITVQCGEMTATITVTCEIPEETEETTEATTDETTEATTDETTGETTEKPEFMLNRKDITFTSKDDSWVLYSGNVPLSDITWSSDDPDIATFENGKVIAVGKGTTTVHAEYEGIKASCIIRCNFAGNIDDDITGNGGVGEDNGDSQPTVGTDGDGTYALYTLWGTTVDDVTISVGEAFTLTLKDSAGNSVDATWSVSDSSVCSAEGSTFTGAAVGVATVTATYNGNTYTCKVRVN